MLIITQKLNRRHIVRRLSESEIRLADQIYPRAEKGELLKKGKKIIADPRIDDTGIKSLPIVLITYQAQFN